MKKIVLLTLFLVFLLSTVVATTSAQERIVGVAEGDWFKYGDFTVSWSSNDPWNPTFPPMGREYLEEMNETEWMLVAVQNISHTIVFFHTVKHFKDGSEVTEEGYVNIDSGLGNMPFTAISANLDENDTIYTSNPFSIWKINKKAVRTYPDGVRETNHLNMTQKTEIIRYVDNSTINGTSFIFINYYWDSSTGILVERSYEVIEQVGEYLITLSMSYRITESSVWTVPEFPAWTPIIFTVVVLTISIALYKRRLLKKPIH
jgi:hypothetical protein